ncbi:unnamed protein product [Prorocentrum cordatum]|uniref:EF-hand domain-containing protein n=1 Tax=Prorocentrum cordatum TaxID=2364126 RepID=A0ABN9US43_9DINO|nr:unnamed protein product [Polarella glacialis]
MPTPGNGTRLPELAATAVTCQPSTPAGCVEDRNVSFTEEVLQLLRQIASTQAEHQHQVLKRLDQLGRSNVGPAAITKYTQAPAAPSPRSVRLPLPSEHGPPLELGPSVNSEVPRVSELPFEVTTCPQGECEPPASNPSSQQHRTRAGPRSSGMPKASKMKRFSLLDHKNVVLERLGAQECESDEWDDGIARQLAINRHMNKLHGSVGGTGAWVRGCCFALLAHPKFDISMGTVIVLNAMMIAVELTVTPTEEDETPASRLAFGIAENVFLSIYLLELIFRIVACGRECLRNSWVRFDLALVCVGVLGSWIVPIIILIAGDAIEKLVPSAMFLRIFRLARLARALRLFVQFRTLWMLISGLFSSLPTIMNVFFVLLLALFVFACLGVEVMASISGAASQEMVDNYFATLPMIMLTLVQFVTMDSVATIYTPMIRENVWLMFFFLPFLLVVSVILMNLVTAVVIEVFLDHAKRDQETRKMYNEQRMSALVPQLRKMFEELDLDDSGCVTLEELNAAPEDVQSELERLLNVDSLYDLFEALDVDGSMEVTIEEFLDGMTRLTCNNQSLEITRVIKLQALIRQDLAELKHICQGRHGLPALGDVLITASSAHQVSATARSTQLGAPSTARSSVQMSIPAEWA